MERQDYQRPTCKHLVNGVCYDLATAKPLTSPIPLGIGGHTCHQLMLTPKGNYFRLQWNVQGIGPDYQTGIVIPQSKRQAAEWAAINLPAEEALALFEYPEA